ncbi:leucine-rich repeat-containing protein 47-like [Hetaerina americana]|uniref:leucine-rich repeat-containing protein 47-like n=1 Tax=Hetaerina americana TaxID=62018 RepID=UPI003A7F1C0E
MEWSEVVSAKLEKRHELVISGEKYSEKIEESGLDNSIFTLGNLNYLSITETCLNILSDEIGNLNNLSTLVLHSNRLTKLPSTIGQLQKLKMLDVSRNQLSVLPEEISDLTQLTSLNLATNCLVSLPSFERNVKLGHLDVSWNCLEDFPDVCHASLGTLADIKLNGNKIKEIPSSIAILSSLKLLNLSDNSIKVVPAELADAPKLKELALKDNKLSDKRLVKLVDQCHYKQVLDYIRQHCPRSSDTSSGGKGKKGKKNKKEMTSSQVDHVDNLCNKLKVLHLVESTPAVKLMDAAKLVRGHIACCIIRNVTFNEESLKKFIQIQTKLHDGICEKRNVSTIATHDLEKIAPGSLMYTAIPPEKIRIIPLMKSKEVTAADLFSQLQNEAEAFRKEKKRSAYSGIHRYLYLLEGKSVFPCLFDSQRRVISFPPITNSDITKLSLSTTNIFVEVTSAASMGACIAAMEALLEETLLLGIGDVASGDDVPQGHTLTVEQVKIVNSEGQLKSVFPSRADLNYDGKSLIVLRE